MEIVIVKKDIYMKIKMVRCVQKKLKRRPESLCRLQRSELFKVYAGYEGLSKLFKAHEDQESVRWCIWY